MYTYSKLYYVCLSKYADYLVKVSGDCIVEQHLLGRLPKVDLIILEGEKCPSVRTSVRPSTKSFFDLNEIWYVGRGR